ncbi:unnamed protein product [Absidia cylindrospora]
MYCHRHNFPEAWAYLWRNWYIQDKFKLWARSATTTIPLAKSTMLVESHWRVLKRNYLYHYNKPRLDLLTYLMLDQHFQSIVNTYQQCIVMRRDVIQWERDFVREWRNHYQHNHDTARDGYHTRLADWICDCPYYHQSRFLMCKHLVRESGKGIVAPRAFFIKRNIRPPFIELIDITNPPSTDLDDFDDEIQRQYQHHPGDLRDQVYDEVVPAGQSRQRGPSQALSVATSSVQLEATAASSLSPLSPVLSQWSPPSISHETPLIVIDSDDDQVDLDIPATRSPEEVVDEERLNRNDEVTMHECRQRVRSRNQQIEDLQRQIQQLHDANEEDTTLEDATSIRYIQRLNSQQANVFIQATDRDRYLESVMAYRRRRTIPRTYQDYNPYTRNL